MTVLNLSAVFEQSASWDDIYHQLKSHDSPSKSHDIGKLFEVFCKYYYLVEPTVKHEYKNIWHFSETPFEVKEKFNLGKIDHGVDLLLEGYDGSISMVQCKFKSDQSSQVSWTKDRIANLFAEGNRADYLIVFTNASGLDNHSLHKSENRLKLVTLSDLLDLSSSTINEIKNRINGIAENKISIKTPREDQRHTIQEVIKGFENNDRGQLILPCGAGKTLTSLWIKEALDVKHTLVLVPSLALLRQIKNEWAENRSYFIPYICVCSEKDIDGDNDSTVTHTYEISGRVSTDPSEIHDFLNKHEKTIVYSTYQSLEAICSAAKYSSFEFDLAICDEAHKTSGSKKGKFGLIHTDINIKVKKRLYMTATPRIMSDSLKNKLNSDELEYIADMSNEAIYGPEFYRMSFKEAIDKGILVDYQIVAIGINDKELEDAIRQRKYISNDETIDEIANNYALEKFMQNHGPTHAITFHSSVKKAKSFQERHKKIYPELKVHHVNGNQTTNERNLRLKDFEYSSKSIITNARCLTEGVDVPAIDVVYFCDPKNSKIDIVQAAGRALRRADHKGKKIGYIVVPIFHKNTEDIEEIIDAGPFKNLVSVIRALCSHDERLITEITKIKITKGQRIVETEYANIEDLSCKLILLENFEAKLVWSLFSQAIDKLASTWHEKYEELVCFYNINGHSNVPTDYPQNKSLSLWVGNQRAKYQKEKLLKERIKKLTDIQFILDPRKAAWEEMFSLLYKYKEETGHCNVPQGFLQNKLLAAWITTQRSKYKKEKLSKEKIIRLRNIDFIFDPKDAGWEIMFTLLSKYKEENGHCDVPKDYQKNKVLGKWASHQRYHNTKGILSTERINKLKDIGFLFNPFDVAWEEKFILLCKFKEENGHSNVSSDDSKNLLLLKWSGKQRSKYQKGKLSKERITKLEDIGFLFINPWDAVWEEMFILLCKYAEKNGHCNIPRNYSENQSLANWIRKQRSKYHNGTLSKKRVKKLESINFIFNSI